MRLPRQSVIERFGHSLPIPYQDAEDSVHITGARADIRSPSRKRQQDKEYFRCSHDLHEVFFRPWAHNTRMPICVPGETMTVGARSNPFSIWRAARSPTNPPAIHISSATSYFGTLTVSLLLLLP